MRFRVWFMALFVALFCIGGSLLAQPETPAPTTPTEWYSSLAGVIAATLVLVSIAKRAVGNISYLNTLPAWLYAVVFSSVLVYVTSVYFKTLPGELWQNLAQGVLSAAAASGFYEWLAGGNATKSLAATAKSAGVTVNVKNMPKRDKK